MPVTPLRWQELLDARKDNAPKVRPQLLAKVSSALSLHRRLESMGYSVLVPLALRASGGALRVKQHELAPIQRSVPGSAAAAGGELVQMSPG